MKKFIGCIGLIAFACNLTIPAANPTTPSVPTVTEGRIVQEDTPSPIPFITATKRIGPEPTHPSPTETETVLPPAPSITAVDFEGMPEALLDYLNSGAGLEEVEEALKQAAVTHQEAPFMSGDLDGDQEKDLVVSILDPVSQTMPPNGALLIYMHNENQYILQANNPFPGGPHLWILKDLDADGRDDLVLSNGTCGAHTCFEEVNILSWDGSGFVNRLEGSSNGLPSPLIEAKDPDGDQVYQLELTGTDYGSVGAGPTRSRTWIWAFDPVSWHWKKTEEVLGEPKYRIHMLQDAEDSAKNGGYQRSLLLYERVAGDDSLQDWVDPAGERATLGAYARFKMYLLYLIQGQPDLAQIIYSDLAATFPEGTPQHVFQEMADVFQQGFVSYDLTAACGAVEQFAAAHSSQILDPLNSFGYANPIFTPQDLCL